MFGLKGDWSLDVKERYFTLEDYCGAEPRWCTGCGDHGILAAVHRVCRDAQLKPEKTVAVSGIGCSSRLPHYMKTYGFHGLHGRALPVACGIKSRRPDLDVWVATGDGDCFSIGAAHWRTYSKQTLRRDGTWTVEAQDEEGRVLARETFVATSRKL